MVYADSCSLLVRTQSFILYFPVFLACDTTVSFTRVIEVDTWCHAGDVESLDAVVVESYDEFCIFASPSFYLFFKTVDGNKVALPEGHVATTYFPCAFGAFDYMAHDGEAQHCQWAFEPNGEGREMAVESRATLFGGKAREASSAAIDEIAVTSSLLVILDEMSRYDDVAVNDDDIIAFGFGNSHIA